MRLNKRILAVTLLAAFALAGASLWAQMPPPAAGGRLATPNVFGAGGMDMHFFAKTIKGAPFSAQATTEEDQTLSDGNQIHNTSTASLYRDGQGRTRREGALGIVGPWAGAEGNPASLIMIHDPVAGVNYVLNPSAHVAHKMPAERHTERQAENAPPGPPGSVQGPPGTGFAFPGGGRFERRVEEEGATESRESLGNQMIGGVQADGTRSTITIPAGAIGNVKPILIVTEQWYSPALQVVVMSKRSDPRIGETTYRLTNITQAEPSPDLFQIPSDYTIQESRGPARLRQP